MANSPAAHHNPTVHELVLASDLKFGDGFSITLVTTGGHNVTTISPEVGKVFYKIDLEIMEHVTPFVMRAVIIKAELDALIELLKGTLETFEKLIQEDAFHLHANSRNMLFL